MTITFLVLFYPVTKERTEQFKTAYLRVKEIKNGLRQDPDWESTYNANELGGPSCVRFNQLEGHFAYEYERNPDFQQFIEKNEVVIQTFKDICGAKFISRTQMNLIPIIALTEPPHPR